MLPFYNLLPFVYGPHGGEFFRRLTLYFSMQKEGINKFYVFCLGQLVDVFFFMSAFLNFMSITRRIKRALKEKEDIAKVLVRIYVQRVLRLYPMFFYFTWYTWKLHRFVVDEARPNQDLNNLLSSLADQHCPLGLLFYSLESVSNCSPPSWYLRTELLMFLGLPIICLVAAHSRVIAAILLAAVLSFTNDNCIYFCAVRDFRLYNFFRVGTIENSNAFYGDFNYAFNFQWQSKLSCYYLGAFVACCLKVYDEILEPRLGKHVRSFSYSISYGTLLLGLYRFLDPLKLKQAIGLVTYSSSYHIIKNSNSYSAPEHWERLCFWRVDFLMNLVLLLIPAFLRVANPVERFLSARVFQFFQVFGKISYPVYLVHTVTILYLQLGEPLKEPISISYLLYRVFAHDILYIVVMSVYLALVVEVPFQNLLKLVI